MYWNIIYGKKYKEHHTLNFYMKKTKTLLAMLLIALSLVTKAQSQKEPSLTKINQENQNLPKDLTTFLKRNPNISNVSWKSENKINIRFKNGKLQSYNLSDLENRKVFVDKYGTPPSPPPPPPSI